MKKSFRSNRDRILSTQNDSNRLPAYCKSFRNMSSGDFHATSAGIYFVQIKSFEIFGSYNSAIFFLILRFRKIKRITLCWMNEHSKIVSHCGKNTKNTFPAVESLINLDEFWQFWETRVKNLGKCLFKKAKYDRTRSCQKFQKKCLQMRIGISWQPFTMATVFCHSHL